MKRIGIEILVEEKAGGAFQYCLAFLDALKTLSQEYDFIILNYSPDLPQADYQEFFKIINLQTSGSSRRSLSVFRLAKRLIYRILLNLRWFLVLDLLIGFIHRDRLSAIESQSLDLMIFPSGSAYAPYLKIPYITTIYDLEHRKHPQFPEVSTRGQWWAREHYYRRLCQTAQVILVDSAVGQEDVAGFYKVSPQKIKVLPYLPPNYLQNDISITTARTIVQDFHLPDRFIFYPAQFWPHKNHANLLGAIKLLVQENIHVPLVLSGFKKEEWGEFERIQKFIKQNQLEKLVFYLGYVNNQEISAIYRLAVALVMPTFFGPTNIPVLEAWKMDCPVLYSDIPGCREQLGPAGLLFNPSDVADIAEKIKYIWRAGPEVRQELIQQGHIRLASWTYQDFAMEIKKIIHQQF